MSAHFGQKVEGKIQRKEGRNSIPASNTTPPFVREGKGPKSEQIQ